MKQTLSILLLACISFFSCEKKSSRPKVENNNKTVVEENHSIANRSKPDIVKDFFASDTYKRIHNKLNDIGVIDRDDFAVFYNNENQNEPIFSFKVVKNGLLKARLNIIPLPNELGYNIPNPQNKTVLPNDDRYIMSLLEFNLVDQQNGEIKFYDYNYGYLVGIRSFVNDQQISSKVLEKPKEIIEAFKDKLFTIKEINPTIDSNPQNYVLCDENRDGNVGFGECYRCFTNACSSDPTCNNQCYIISYLTPYNCGVSIGAACAFISLY